jgi:hypothetical protein
MVKKSLSSMALPCGLGESHGKKAFVVNGIAVRSLPPHGKAFAVHIGSVAVQIVARKSLIFLSGSESQINFVARREYFFL